MAAKKTLLILISVTLIPLAASASVDNYTLSLKLDHEKFYADSTQITTGTYQNLDYPYIVSGQPAGIASYGSFKQASYYNLSKGLVAYYPLDSLSGSTAEDKSQAGNENDGTLKNSPTWTDARIKNGLDFNENDYVNVKSSPSLNTDSGITLTAWVKPRESKTFFDGFESGNFTYFNKIYPEEWRINNGRRDVRDWCGDAPAVISKFDHISGSESFCTPPNGTYGLLLRSSYYVTSPTFDLSGASSATLSGFWKGRSHDSGTQQTKLYVYDGTSWTKVDCIEDIGDGAINDTTCTAGDDSKIHHFSVDVTPYRNNNFKFRFEGSPGFWDDTVIDNVKLNVTGDTISSHSPVVMKGGNSKFSTYGLWVSPEKAFGHLGSPTEEWNTTNETGLSASIGNGWQHLALTYNRREPAKLYINGALKDTEQKKGDISLSAKDLKIGKKYFGGQLDDIRVYNRSLSESEVNAVYRFDGGGAAQGDLIQITQSSGSFLLPFTHEGVSTIESRQELVKSRSFLQKLEPSFGFYMPELPTVRVIYPFNQNVSTNISSLNGPTTLKISNNAQGFRKEAVIEIEQK